MSIQYDQETLEAESALLKGHYGIIRVTRDIYEHQSALLRDLLADVGAFICDVSYDVCSQSFDLTLACPVFDVVNCGEQIPEYSVVFTKVRVPGHSDCFDYSLSFTKGSKYGGAFVTAGEISDP